MNVKVIRALGSLGNNGNKHCSPDYCTEEAVYDYFMIGLSTDRQLLYQRIDQRVDQMVGSRFWFAGSTTGADPS